MEPVRQLIRHQVQALFGSGGQPIDLDYPRGDPGLFGPGSAVWRVHADFTAMMTGGIAALLLQMLHPRALAGVWDHSNFRDDMQGRLRRTAQFVAATSYGSRAEAERLIARVRAIHDRVAGTLPDGTTYSANDPELLTWVHVAEVSSFLAGHLRFRDPAMSGAEQDRYLAEVAMIAERLGATDVPKSRRAVEAYFQAIRPELRADARTREVVAALTDAPAPSLLATPFRNLTMEAAIGLLPPWAAAMHGFKPGPQPLVRGALGGVGSVLRWALTEGSAARAMRRVSPQ